MRTPASSDRWSIGLGILAGLLAAATAAMAYGTPTRSGLTAEVEQTCNAALSTAREYGPIEEIIAGDVDSAANVARWQEQRHASHGVRGLSTPFRDLAPEVMVTTCVYRGTFPNLPQGPPSLGNTKPYSFLRLLVMEDGSVTFDSAGHEGGMDPLTPKDLDR